MTPPDSVGKVAELVALLRDRANDHGGDKLLTDAADCLQALDRQRQEECEHLRSMYRNACKELALANEATLQARAAAEGVERDAARYRWLRDKAPDTWDVSRWLDNDTQEIHLQDDLDAAIDAAMRDSGEGRG